MAKPPASPGELSEFDLCGILERLPRCESIKVYRRIGRVFQVVASSRAGVRSTLQEISPAQEES
jgi:hypothetical protein